MANSKYDPTTTFDERVQDKVVIDQFHDILEKHPEVWTQGNDALDDQGRSADARRSENVCKVCLRGGLIRLARNEVQAHRLLTLASEHLPGKHANGRSVTGFNDHKTTVVDDVKAYLKHLSTHIKHLNGG